MPSTSPLPSLVLVWPSNCGCGTRQLMTAVRPSRKSSPRGDEVFEEAAVFAVVVDAAGEGGAEAGEVRAAFGRVDVVDVGVDVLGVLGRVLQGDFDGDAFGLAFDVQDIGVDGLAGAVEVLRRIARRPSSYWYDSFSPVRSSAIVMRTPWLRKASSWMRFCSVA